MDRRTNDMASNMSFGPFAAARTGDRGFSFWEITKGLSIYDVATEDLRTFLDPHWFKFPALHPLWYYVFGMVYFFIASIAIFGNITVLRIFSRFQTLRTPANVLVMNLAMADLCLMLSLMPECIINFFLGGPWIFGELACQIHAFLGALFGYLQMYTLTIISYDRYNVIVKGMNGSPLTYGKATLYVIIGWIWSLGWSISPLVGWGGYAVDGLMATCSFDYITRTTNNITHILAAVVFIFGIPLLFIIFCYSKIVGAVFHHESQLREQAKKMNVQSLRSNQDQQQSAEIRIAKVSVTTVSLWVLAWTPFTVISLMGVFADPALVTPLITSLPVMLAKTSCSYNPIIYTISHPKYRECLKEMYPWMCIVVNEKKTNTGGDNESSKTEQTEKP